MTDLTQQSCEPCKGGVDPMDEATIAEHRKDVPEWDVTEQDGEKQLKRVFTFDDFSAALAFTNQVGELAEKENHHPALLTEWGKVTVRWWTHKIRGLHENDFICAAKTDAL